MFDFRKLYDDSTGIDIILDKCDEQVEYYKKAMDAEISTDNNSDKIKYYRYAIANLENTIGDIIKDNPGNKAVVYLLCALDQKTSGFAASNLYFYTVLSKAIEYRDINQLYMIYLRDTIYVKSLHNVIKERINELSIFVDMSKSNDDNFGYSTNNIISELEKMDLLEHIDIDRVKYISEIYVMIFGLMDYYDKVVV